MSFAKIVKGFDINKLLKDTDVEGSGFELTIGETKYLVKVEDVIEGKTLKIRFSLLDGEEMEPLPIDKDMILIFRLDKGIYHIPINIKEQELVGGESICSANLAGKALYIERRAYKRVKFNKEVNISKGSKDYLGFIEDISTVGAKIYSKDRIREDKVVIDISFAGLSFTSLMAKVIWAKDDNDGYKYGLNFEFEDICQQKEISEFIY
ncbi:PilZ domain-containing protein [Halonatronum saccharophilum]|uniref:PilZ domain-containing protein n=1 Tax=Halonatronum saccharophilum TaxID=150060 RepID=UPI000489796F|nr:PilZ domain-containing protein [Halonatronum saccharophilum]